MQDPPARRFGGTLTIKLCLAGDQGVGKTSTVRRFVSDTFDESYLHTLGAKVSSREYTVPDPARPDKTIAVAASIWDVMGSHGFRETLKDAYFHNTQGVLLVLDGGRLETLRNLRGWYESITSIAGEIPVFVLANKHDLPEDARIPDATIDQVCSPQGWRWLWTSAKTGENVARAFTGLTELYVHSLRGDPAILASTPKK